MSYTRVMVLETTVPFSKVMRAIKKDAEPVLNGQVKAGNLNRWQIVQTGETSGFIINEFDNKAQMNRYNKGVSGARQDIGDAAGAQMWAYHGTVNASG